jgi:probable F420-dependent oxidoreductase
MRFSVQLATENVARPEEFLSAAAIGEMARTAEDAGFDACFVTDHPIPEDAWLAAGGHHALDPFVALSFAAAATRRIRLLTNLLVLPYRNPFLVAKAAATLDVASGGRLILGVGTGYLAGEFAALGLEVAGRNEASDEALAAMKAAWRGESVKLSGRHFRAEGNTALPRPAQAPHPPIWVGGNSKRAIRRAVEHGDAWMPFPAGGRMAERTGTATIRSLDDLSARAGYAREHAEAVGRTRPLEIVFIPFGFTMQPGEPPDLAPLVDAIPAYAALGVTWLSLGVPCATRAEYQGKVEALGAALTGR